MPEPAVLTVPEAAKLLRVSEWTVGTMTRDGRLPKVPGIRRIRIPAAAVHALGALIALNDDGRSDRIAAARVAMADCTMLPRDQRPKGCAGCGALLTGLRRRWCRDECSDRWWVNHSWTMARAHAIAQAGGDEARCARCGCRIGYLAEVNHIVPREGQGYGRGCHHHQNNLEVLCHDCHTIETTRQLQARRARRA